MTELKYPKPLTQSDTIGVTSPSHGVEAEMHARLDFSISGVRESGFQILEGACLRKKLNTAQDRADDFHRLWKDPTVKAIIPPWGGEYLMEILPLLDKELIRKFEPKWVLGYSDTSTLLFHLTNEFGIATAHGPNLMDIAPVQVDSLTQNWKKLFALKNGELFVQKSSSKYMKKWIDFRTEPTSSLSLPEDTHWNVLSQKKSVNFSGRLIGGCIESLGVLVGTQYGEIDKFFRRIHPDPTVVFLEPALDESYTAFTKRSLWHFKHAGWFEGASGILLGRRPAARSEVKDTDLTYREAIMDILGPLSIPVVFDVDIGHVPPQLTLVNGAWADINVEDGKGTVHQVFK